MQYSLGLDIGSSSVGWALLTDHSIIRAGVRVFPEGVDRDTKGLEVSRNAARREARGARRIKSRRAQRRHKLVAILREAGFLPKEDSQLKALLRTEPYSLRARGLDNQLDKFEFGRVLYHINLRRGFKSNRKSDKAKDGIVNKSATELQKKIDESNCRTIGEYFSTLDPHEQQLRGHYTFRSMYEKEFDLLWAKQSEFYPDTLKDDLRKRIRDETIFFQRPLKPSDELIGDCELETGEKRCPRGDWYARRFRILQTVNNLKLRQPTGQEDELNADQRKSVLEDLESKGKITFCNLRKKLGLLETQKFNFEPETGNGGKKAKDYLEGDAFSEAMTKPKLFGKKWMDIPTESKVLLNEAVVELDDDALREFAAKEHGFDREQCEMLMKVSLPQSYMSYSRKAIIKLLPPMEQGLRTDEAVRKIYGERNKGAQTRGSLDFDLLPDLRNPLVARALHEVRKVVNAIIREHGKPAQIYLEMARDLKNSRSKREEIQKQIWDKERENAETRTRLIEDANIEKPSRDDVTKYKLWQECGRMCPYTGKAIGLHEIFGEHPVFQVEHILPYSRSLDDSFANKTLCHEDENRRKGNKTPYEFYGIDEGLLKRIAILPYGKRRKFTQEKIELDKCIERQLNDTRYICRETSAYLKTLGVNVMGTRGEATFALRQQWGLNTVLNGLNIKNRDDHRHHAIDAVVTALTRPEHLRKLAETRFGGTRQKFEEPWPEFRRQVEEMVNAINISHRVTKKVSGQLHEETSYGITSRVDEKQQPFYAYRKPLEALTPAMVEKIIDPVVRGIVRDRLKEFGLDSENGSARISREVWKEPLYMKSVNGVKVPIKKVRIQDVFNNLIPVRDPEGRPYRAVASGNNHHVEIFEYTDDKKQVRRDGRIVSLFEASRRLKNGEPVVRREHGPGRKFVCSLARNEMFMLNIENGTTMPHRVQKITQSDESISIILRPHTYAGQVKDTDKPPLIQRRSPNTLKGYKINVDPLGKIWAAND
jgi:CRISPR-associated endonuclease Csn1